MYKTKAVYQVLLEMLSFKQFCSLIGFLCMKSGSINMSKNLMFIHMQKFNFMPHLLHKILHFKESHNLIG